MTIGSPVRGALALALIACLTVAFSQAAMAQFHPPAYEIPDLPAVQTGSGQTRCVGRPPVDLKIDCREFEEPDPGKLYVADSGAHLYIFRPYGRKKDQDAPLLHVLAKAGSNVEVRGANITAIFQTGSNGIVMDGVRADVYGNVTLYGSAVVRAFQGAKVNDQGRDSNVYAFAGSLIRSQARGRVYAYDGSTVYAKSPDECDDCTQVRTFPGSLSYIYEATEAFSEGGTVHVLPGGDVHGSNGTIVYLYEGGHWKVNEDCKVITASSNPPPFPQW